jgi:hypothetical protein
MYYIVFTNAFLEWPSSSMFKIKQFNLINKGNNKITELWTILQRESQNS